MKRWPGWGWFLGALPQVGSCLWAYLCSAAQLMRRLRTPETRVRHKQRISCADNGRMVTLWRRPARSQWGTMARLHLGTIHPSSLSNIRSVEMMNGMATSKGISEIPSIFSPYSQGPRQDPQRLYFGGSWNFLLDRQEFPCKISNIFSWEKYPIRIRLTEVNMELHRLVNVVGIRISGLEIEKES